MKQFFVIIGVFMFASAFANKFYIDPANGSNAGDGTIISPWKTLENVINQNLIESKSYVIPYDSSNSQLVAKNIGAPIKAGDTLMLYSGLHGEINIVNYINDSNIMVMNVQDNLPIFKSLHIQAGKNWVFQGIEISSEPYGTYINDKLVFLESHNWQGPVSNIMIQDCNIYSTLNAWQDTTNWVTKASDGIVIWGDSINIFNNKLLNIRFGISMKGDNIDAYGNIIENFAGDGIRLLGSNCIVEKNIIKNCYAVDDNHDDGIQSFTTGGIVVNNNIVRQNIIINYEDPNQPLLGSLQGIGCFDGPFYNWSIENNLIVVNSWHGIAFYGLINSSIINNTVLDPTPNISPGPSWIKVDDDTSIPSSNCVVKNNVSNTISVTTNTTVSNNVLLQTLADYDSNFIDYTNNDFHLLESSQLIDMADITIAPNVDLDGNTRPSGSLPDIGAYEYQYLSSINHIEINNCIEIYPNPFSEYINIIGIDANYNINILDINGRAIKSYNNIKLPAKLLMNYLNHGIYLIQIADNSHKISKTYKLLK